LLTVHIIKFPRALNNALSAILHGSRKILTAVDNATISLRYLIS